MTPFPCELTATEQRADLARSIGEGIPEISTDRLILRVPRVDDFDYYSRIVCSERGAFVGGPMTRADAWYDFSSMIAGWVLHGHGLWTIEAKEITRPVGFVVIGFEPGDLEPELGFFVTEFAEGKGYALEAASAARQFALDTLKLDTLVSYIDPRNLRSIALAKRLDAHNEGFIGSGDDRTLVFRHARPEDV